MIFILGFLSLLQALFLPGLIIARFMRINRSGFLILGMIVALSLLVNFYLVVFLVLIKLYTFLTLILIVGIEIIVLGFLYWRDLKRPIHTYAGVFRRAIGAIQGYFFTSASSRYARKILLGFKVLFFAGALFSLGWVCISYINGFGEVFTSWDAIVSYNRWATEWSNNIFPTGACEYPQLLPANWSLTYIFTRTDVVFFARMMQGVFPVMLIALLFNIAIIYRSYGMMLAAPVMQLILTRLLGDSLFDGYMDAPVAAVAFLSFYIILVDQKNGNFSRKTLWYSMFAAAIAALIKQPGLMVWACCAVLNLVLLIKYQIKSLWHAVYRLLPMLVVSGIIIGLWYIPRFLVILQGKETSCFATVLSWAVEDVTQNYWQALLVRLKSLGSLVVLLPSLLLALLTSKGIFRFWNLAFAIPYLCISLFYGDLWGLPRYLSPIYASLALAFGINIEWFVDWFCARFLTTNGLQNYIAKLRSLWPAILGKWDKISQKVRGWLLIVLLVASVFALSLKYTDTRLENSYIIKQKNIGHPELNAFLLAFYEQADPNAITLSFYPYVTYIPGLEERKVIYYYYTDLVSYEAYINNPDVKYLLFPRRRAAEEVEAYIYAEISQGNYQIIEEIDQGYGWHNLILVEIVHRE